MYWCPFLTHLLTRWKTLNKLVFWQHVRGSDFLMYFILSWSTQLQCRKKNMFAVLMTNLLLLVVFTVFPCFPFSFFYFWESSDFNDLLNGCIPKLQYQSFTPLLKKNSHLFQLQMLAPWILSVNSLILQSSREDEILCSQAHRLVSAVIVSYPCRPLSSNGEAHKAHLAGHTSGFRWPI